MTQAEAIELLQAVLKPFVTDPGPGMIDVHAARAALESTCTASPSPATDADEDRVELFKELNWCIEEGNIGPRSKKAIIAARNFVASTRTASDTRTAAGEAECDAALRAAPASQHDADASANDEIVGHKTFSTEGGGFRHEPLRRSEADAIMEQVEARERHRAELMPDEAAARNMHFEAWLRLKELGWREAVYCPKDGTEFEVIEAGSTGVHRCFYSGEWPSGHWLILADGDAYPSRPVLYRSVKETASATVPRVGGNTQPESFAVELGRESIAARTQADAGKAE